MSTSTVSTTTSTGPSGLDYGARGAFDLQDAALRATTQAVNALADHVRKVRHLEDASEPSGRKRHRQLGLAAATFAGARQVAGHLMAALQTAGLTEMDPSAALPTCVVCERGLVCAADPDSVGALRLRCACALNGPRNSGIVCAVCCTHTSVTDNQFWYMSETPVDAAVAHAAVCVPCPLCRELTFKQLIRVPVVMSVEQAIVHADDAACARVAATVEDHVSRTRPHMVRDTPSLQMERQVLSMLHAHHLVLQTLERHPHVAVRLEVPLVRAAHALITAHPDVDPDSVQMLFDGRVPDTPESSGSEDSAPSVVDLFATEEPC